MNRTDIEELRDCAALLHILKTCPTTAESKEEALYASMVGKTREEKDVHQPCEGAQS